MIYRWLVRFAVYVAILAASCAVAYWLAYVATGAIHERLG